ncbi:MAG: thioredoxin domain-containing protein, partial [Candidatus Limnocylindria bacterium]
MTTESFHFSPRPNRAAEIAWRPWGPQAFDEARAAGKPILLAISAVWCHWCHVMDETSYSDEQVILAINERYLPIRVDNDQRPDVNRRYNMGGWPTTAFLTPEGEIIHGGTYIPPEAMRSYLGQVADVWRDRRGELERRVKELREQQDAAAAPAPGELGWDIVDAIGSLIRGQYDPQYGGFGREPKFPQPKLLRFLIDEYRRHAYPDVATMLHKTLGAMAGGGMYDGVEGGFFRYSTTRQWQIPHFEKMLEDNAELLAIYAEAHRTFPAAGYERVVRDVMRWMDAVLWRDDAAAFAGSQDADEHYYALDAAERAKHGAPYVDATIYTGWNALAASAYLAAGAVERPLAALRAIHTRLMGAGGAVFHFDGGDGARVADLLADLAPLLGATLDAYETGADPEALERAEALATRLRERLEDVDRGGFHDAPERDEPGRVSRREKPIEDGAAAADGLLRLAALTGEERWRESALRALRGFAGEYRQWGQFAAGYG